MQMLSPLAWSALLVQLLLVVSACMQLTAVGATLHQLTPHQ
jgi:hypothetical protein